MIESSNITRLREIVGYDVKASRFNEVKELVSRMSGDGYWAWCFNGDCCYLASPLKKLLGYKVNEITNFNDFNELLVDGDKERFLKVLDKHINKKNSSPFKVILNYKHKKGNIIKLLCRGMIVEWDENNKPMRMVGSFINITDCKDF